MEAQIIKDNISKSFNHVIYFKLPEKIKNLSKAQKLLEIDNCISLLKRKGEWNDSTK